MAQKRFRIGQVEVGGADLVIIAGPCAVESRETALVAAEHLHRLAETHHIGIIYKSSYAKANRLSADSFSTIGIDEALRILEEVKREFSLPLLTDVHSPAEIPAAAQVVDCLQIPAFLCRQTELVEAAARTNLPINIKKGQFMAPEDMGEIAQKAVRVGNDKIMLTERGTTFGYHDLVVDFRSLPVMAQFGFPVIFDCTHSVQKPGALSGRSGGQRQFVAPLARAAIAVGVDGLFVETHPNPKNARSDSECQVELAALEKLLLDWLKLWRATSEDKDQGLYPTL